MDRTPPPADSIIESVGPEDGPPLPHPAEVSAWALRRRLPSELAAQISVRWPIEAAHLSGIPAATLEAKRKEGDAPRLFAVGRTLVTTAQDMRDWLERHEIAPGQRLRPPTSGSKRRAGVEA